MKKARPDRAIYQPGSTKLTKFNKIEENNSIHENENDISLDNQKIKKKPDIEIYVPKKRLEHKTDVKLDESIFSDIKKMILPSNKEINDYSSKINRPSKVKTSKNVNLNNSFETSIKERKIPNNINDGDVRPLLECYNLTEKELNIPPLLSLNLTNLNEKNLNCSINCLTINSMQNIDNKPSNTIENLENNNKKKIYLKKSISEENSNNYDTISKNNHLALLTDQNLKDMNTPENSVKPSICVNKKYEESKINLNLNQFVSQGDITNIQMNLNNSKNKNNLSSKTARRDINLKPENKKSLHYLENEQNLLSISGNKDLNVNSKNLSDIDKDKSIISENNVVIYVDNDTNKLSSKDNSVVYKNFCADVASGNVGGIIRIPAGTSVNSVSEPRKLRDNPRKLYNARIDRSNEDLKINKMRTTTHDYFNNENSECNNTVTLTPVLEMQTGNFKNYADNIIYLDNQLKKFLQAPYSDSIFSNINYLRFEMLHLCSYSLFEELELTVQQNVQDLVWRSCFHQTIEWLKKNNVSALLPNLITQSLYHFEKLLSELETNYNFRMDENSKNLAQGRTQKLLLVVYQKIAISLGDLERYQQLQLDQQDFDKSVKWYLAAQQLLPKNGKPYNQLAILSMYTRHKLEAVYYCVRSLASANPFLSARESLCSLFHDAFKRVEKDKKEKEKQILEKRKKMQKVEHHQARCEVWISSNGLEDKDDEDDDDEAPDKLSLPELNKKFVFNFLNLLGMLFSKIGLDAFDECLSNFLSQLNRILSISPLPLNSQRWLQIVIISIFVNDNISSVNELQGSCCRSLVEELSSQMLLVLMAHFMKRCLELLQLPTNHERDSKLISNQDKDIKISTTINQELQNLKIGSNNQDLETMSTNQNKDIFTFGFTEDVRILMFCIKVICDWILCFKNRCHPPPLPFDPLIKCNLDVWDTAAIFFSYLQKFPEISHHISLTSDSNSISVILPEDVFVFGFVPLLPSFSSPVYLPNSYPQHVAEDLFRINKLLTCAQVLCGQDQPLLGYNVVTKRYESKVDKNEARINKNESAFVRNESVESVNYEHDNSENVEHIPTWGSDVEDQDPSIEALRNKKQRLTKHLQIQSQRDAQMSALIKEKRTMVIEVRPRFLVMDTNCFIDHLDLVQNIVKSKKYTLTIPLIVINELDWLSKKGKQCDPINLDQSEWVKQESGRSLAYLDEEFDKRNEHIRAMTSKGNLLASIEFRCEEIIRGESNNDDLILSCCVFHCFDKPQDYMPKSPDEPIKIKRDVVLLTNDRNLRLKAHLSNIPAKNIVTFARWANILT